MNVFLSWSGPLSKKVANIFREWLPSVLQNVQPYFSPDDIEKGQRWSSEIADALNGSDFGILFVTRDSRNSPWLIFEAGALSKKLENSRVIPFLIGVEPTDLEGPLAQFQACAFEEQDLKKLVRSLNDALSQSLKPDVVEKVFKKFWPDLKEEIEKAMAQNPDESENEEVRTERELLEEVLTRVRSIQREGVAPIRAANGNLIGYRVNNSSPLTLFTEAVRRDDTLGSDEAEMDAYLQALREKRDAEEASVKLAVEGSYEKARPIESNESSEG